MINLYDIVNEGNLLCEAFADPRLYQAQKSLLRYKLTWDKLFDWRAKIAWDKIGPEDIEEVDNADLDKLFKDIRSRKRNGGRPFVLLGMKNERLQYIYDAVYYDFGMLKFYHTGGSVEWRHKNSSGGGKDHMSEKMQFEYLKECDYVLKVYIDDKSVSDLMNQRRDAISGAWILTKNDHESKHLEKGVLGTKVGGRKSWDVDYNSFYAMCRRMADEANKRWKKIVADNKFKRSSDTSEVDNAVKGIMGRITTACTNAMKDPVKYDSKNTGITLEKLMKKIYDKNSWSGSGRNMYRTGTDGLLVHYQKFCEAVMNLQKIQDGVDTGYYSSSDTYIAQRDESKKLIFRLVLEIDMQLSKFDA